MEADVDAIIRRNDQLKSAKRDHEYCWHELQRWVLPDSTSITYDSTPRVNERAHLFDNIGEEAAMIAAAGIYGMTTNPGSAWFNLETEDRRLMADREVAAWLDLAEEFLLSAFNSPQTRFSAVKFQTDVLDVTYGNSCSFIESRTGRLPVVHLVPLREVSIAIGADGVVDTVFREVEWPASLCFKRFGAAAGEKVAKMVAEGEEDEKFCLIHAVFPREVPGGIGIGKLQKPFASVWVNKDERRIISRGGYDEMPYVFSRLWTNGDGDYGRGWGAQALYAVKSLQLLAKTTLKSAEQAIAPPWAVMEDTLLQPLRTSANAINMMKPSVWATNSEPISPLNTGARPDIGVDMILNYREAIERAFRVPLFRFVKDPHMTATHAMILDEERLRDIGPFIANMQAEKMGPSVERFFNIFQREKFFPPAPEALDGKALKVVYSSPSAQQQRIDEGRSLLAAIDASASFGNIFGPEVYDNLDGDSAYRKFVQRMGVSAQHLRGEGDRDQMREARNQQMAQTAELEDLATAGGAAQSFAQAAASAGMVDREAA